MPVSNGTLILIGGQTSAMSDHIDKTGENIHHHATSPKKSAWSITYNRSIDEIQHIFDNCGKSIARTIEILRGKNKSADTTDRH